MTLFGASGEAVARFVSLPERRQMGERVRRGLKVTNRATAPTAQADFDPDRAAAILPLIEQLLGLTHCQPMGNG